MKSIEAYYDENYRRFLPADRDSRILDIGCGQGDLLRFLSSLSYRRVTGIDRAAEAIARLQEMDGVTAKIGDAGTVLRDGAAGGWSLIIAKQMIYYIDRPSAPAFVSSLAEALVPDGRLIVEVFNGSLLSSRFTELKDPAILTAYTENGLRRLLEANGFVVEHLFGAVSGGRRGLRSALYAAARALWFSAYRCLLVLERGRDDELPCISSKSIIAVASRREE